jgi:hypothetical protein
MDFIDSDRSLQVGDYVFHNYSKNSFLWKITKITRRFLTQDDLRYGVYKNANIGNEYNPYVEIESIADLGFNLVNKKYRKQIRYFDAVYLIKVDPKVIQNHINTLNKVLKDFWT